MNRSLVLGIVVALAVVPACGVFDGGSGDRQNSALNDPVTKNANGNGDGSQDIDLARPAFQTKSSDQLQRSIVTCVGGDAIWVTKEMISPPDKPTPGSFLTSDFSDGDDIVAVQSLLFDGPPESQRTGVRVDQISLEYLTALKNVANVVGYRCQNALTDDDTLCACETDDQAKAMLARCLSAVADPTTPAFADLAKDFGAMCQQSRGSAIASMIASLAFAKVP
jgi:hypothetical protein